MGASPELFREVDGSRIAAVSVFFRSLATVGPACAPQIALPSGCDGSLELSLNSFVQNNAETAICCHRCAAGFVGLNVENRTTEFVPRFSIMHGSIESHAAH
jgi:hypothetical protein